MKALWIICIIYCFIWAPILANTLPWLWLIVDLILLIGASVFLIYQKKKKQKIDDSIYPIICMSAIFARISLVQVKNDINIPQFTDGFMYYLPRILIIIWFIPTILFALFYGISFLLLILKSKWLDDFEKWKNSDKFMDYFWMAVFLWRWLASIWLIIWTLTSFN